MTPARRQHARFADDQLVVFVGYAADASAQARQIKDVATELQDELTRRILNEQRPGVPRVVTVFTWESDAPREVGGQDENVTPAVDRADMAVFVFRGRVGAGTQQELDRFRAMRGTHLPLIAFFPDGVPVELELRRLEGAADWADTLRLERELLAGWLEPSSSAVTPAPRYQDESLPRLFLEEFRKHLSRILDTRAGESAPPAIGERAEDHFLDGTARVVEIHDQLVANYRERLRPEARVFPGESNREFLARSGFTRNGLPTRAACLLFSPEPEREIQTAMVRFTVYDGAGLETKHDRRDIKGPAYVQIQEVMDSVATRIKKREALAPGTAESFMVYQYPMVCLQELVANAVGHRRYDEASRFTAVRVFSDRIEISSPGTWAADESRLTADGPGIPLQRLIGPSVSRNHRLADAIAKINMFQLEGGGLSKAIADCATARAMMPFVCLNAGFVVVTVFPRGDWDAPPFPELVRVPAGGFSMGSPDGESGRSDDEGPVHDVAVSAFEIGRHQVTNLEFASFLSANPGVAKPPWWADPKFCEPMQPVVGVTWEQARQFAAWAGCRLPTEAEWEYAARGGTTTSFHSGDTEEQLRKIAWYEANSGGCTRRVGAKAPNAFGLHDMLGNVWEWMEDDSHVSYTGAPSDGTAWVERPRAKQRVVRGGAFDSQARRVRVATREWSGSSSAELGVGFRVARSLPSGGSST